MRIDTTYGCGHQSTHTEACSTCSPSPRSSWSSSRSSFLRHLSPNTSKQTQQSHQSFWKRMKTWFSVSESLYIPAPKPIRISAPRTPENCTERARAQRSGICRLCELNQELARKKAAETAYQAEKKQEYLAIRERKLQEIRARELQIRQEAEIKRLSDDIMGEIHIQLDERSSGRPARRQPERVDRRIPERAREREVVGRTNIKQRPYNAGAPTRIPVLQNRHDGRPTRHPAINRQQGGWI